MVSRSAISWTMVGCLSVICYLSIFGSNFIHVYAQEAEDLIVRRVAVWDLFYQGMVAAFVVGALVQGYINLHLLAIQGIQPQKQGAN